jgi:FkbM family methyltransferase
METTFNIPPLRKGHKVDLGESTCYWFEMDHPGEGERTLLEIFDVYLNKFNWDKFIKPGSTVIDIGGHSGDTAVPMQFLARGTVLSIEPNPSIKQYLDFTCNMNGHLGKFVTAHEAVTTVDMEVEILDHNNALCNGGVIDPTWTPELQQRMVAAAGNKITVPGLRLDNLLSKYLTEEEINNIGFIKTDTEGHDKSILESSKDLIARLKPVIFTEWFFAYTDAESRDLFRVIEELDYLPFYPTTLEPANVNQRSDDLVLIHKDRINEFL